jgi:hypothetical protein
MSARQISAASTFFTKWGFLVIWLLLGCTIVVGFARRAGAMPGEQDYLPYLIVIGGAVLWWLTCHDLADRVTDLGDYLRVRRGFKTDDISISSIVGARYSTASNPVRLTLELDCPSLFGNKIAFLPVRTGQGGLFSRNELADELLGRANAARAKR